MVRISWSRGDSGDPSGFRRENERLFNGLAEVVAGTSVAQNGARRTLMPEEVPSHPGFATRLRASVAALLTLVVAAGSYAFHELNVAQQLTAQTSAVSSTLNRTRDQMSALTAQTESMNAERQADETTS